MIAIDLMCEHQPGCDLVVQAHDYCTSWTDFVFRVSHLLTEANCRDMSDGSLKCPN